MINQVRDNGRDYFAIFGHRFATREAAVAYRDETIARREQLAGRQLSMREHIRGVAHHEDRDVSQRAHDDNWAPIVAETPDDGNPHRRRLAEMKEDRRREKLDPRSAMLEDAAAKWDAEHERSEVQAAEAPRRQAAVENAEAHYERVKFDPSQPMSELVRAEQLLAQAKQGDLDTYQTMAQEVQDRHAEAHDEQRQALDAEYRRSLADLQARAPGVLTNEFVHAGDTVQRVRRYGGAEEIQVTYQRDGRTHVRHTWGTEDAPESVSAMGT